MLSPPTLTQKALSDDSAIPQFTTSPTKAGFEIGDDFQISFTMPQGDQEFVALGPAVAYNSTEQEFLVVWYGVHDIVNEYEIWGQLVDAVTGTLVGSNFKISNTGYYSETDPIYDAYHPDVVYNPVENEYLVVWDADHIEDEAFNIYAKRIDGSNPNMQHSAVKVNAIPPIGDDPDYDCLNPAVAYNNQDNEYMVVYHGETNHGDLVDDEVEIWAKQLDADGLYAGLDHRISDMGADGDTTYRAESPDIAYNPLLNQYYIVWSGSNDEGTLVPGKFEVYGQRVDSDLTELGTNDIRISYTGPDTDFLRDANNPAVIFNATRTEYVVVWHGDQSNTGVQDILGQRLAYNGWMHGPLFYISAAEPGMYADYYAHVAAIALDTYNNEYFVVWSDDSLREYEYEIWGQRLKGSGESLGVNQRLSTMGTDGDVYFDGDYAAIAYSDTELNTYLVVWRGDNTINEDYEIWGQFYKGAVKVFLPMVMKD
jgi:hypothetical protein